MWLTICMHIPFPRRCTASSRDWLLQFAGRLGQQLPTPSLPLTICRESGQRRLGARLMDGTETGWGRAWRISRLDLHAFIPTFPWHRTVEDEGGKGQELSSQRHVVERAVPGARGAAQPATQRRACAKKSDGRRWPRFQDGIRNAWEPSFLAEGFPHGRRRLADAGGSRMFSRRWDPCVEPLGRISCFESTRGARSHGSLQS